MHYCQLTRIQQFLVDTIMKNESSDAQALESIFETSMSKYAELNPSHCLSPADTERVIAELRDQLRL